MIKNKYLFLGFLISLIAMMGSLYFSEIMKFVPCTLCWYQRIAMYPLVIILFIGSTAKYDVNIVKITLVQVLAGLTFSIYQNALVYGFIDEGFKICIQGSIPCDLKYLNYFNFITIPLMSFTAFLLILIALLFNFLAHKD